MMIDVRQNKRAAAEPPSNLRVEKYCGFYSLYLFIKYHTEMAKFFTNARSAGNLEIIFTGSAKKVNGEM